MAFRRIILKGNNVEEVKKDLERLFSLPKHKIDFPELKIDIKYGINPNTLVVDVNGEGADSVSKKVKDIGLKFNIISTIKTEIPMKTKTELKEAIKSILKENRLKEEVSPLEMAEGNINEKELGQCSKLVAQLAVDLQHSGYFDEIDECLDLVLQIIKKNISKYYVNPYPFQHTQKGGIVGLNEKNNV